MKNEHDRPVILPLEETHSTNQYLREWMECEPLAEGTVVTAGYQTAGRGQVGNGWESEKDKNLLFSLLLYPDFLPANRQFLISQIAALAVKDTLSLYTDSVTVKWPNDIYWKDRKICGMLIENDLSGQNLYCSIIGIGINLNQSVFRGDAPNPVSLFQITGKEYDREEMLTCFLHIFFNYYVLLLKEEYEKIKQAYMTALYRNKGFHSYSDANGVFEACVYDVKSTGHLVLQLKDGTLRQYAFKEVSYKIFRK